MLPLDTAPAVIFIAADFLMTRETEQFNNRRWFRDLLQRPISVAAGEPARVFMSSLTDPGRLSRKEFFARSGLEMANTMHFWFDPAQVSDASIAYLQQFLPAGSIVVGYELGEPTRAVLTRAGVRYIDVWLHPIRFYDDVLFGVSSATPEVFAALAPFHVPDEQFWLYADRLKIQLYKGFRRDETPLAPNSALLVGQTLEDKAICRRGKMLTLLDFKEQVQALAREHERVYFSRHPFVKAGDGTVLQWLQSLPNLELTQAASYHLIANPAIKTVAALSSSVVHEARFFGKKTQFFYKPIFTFGQRFGRDYLSIYHDIASPHFWAAALAPLRPVRADAPVVLFRDGKDKFRDMLAFYWGWATVDKTEAMRQKLNAVASRVHQAGLSAKAAPPVDAPLPTLTPGETEARFLARARAAFAGAQVVSFDVFDTVLERPFENYESLFSLMAPEVEALTGLSASEFIALRKRSRALSESRRTNEEAPLPLRYRVMLEAAGVAPEAAGVLASYEFEMDLRVLQARPLGKKLVELAQSLGKRVVFVSDIYYSTEQVCEMLERCGFAGYERVFTSCEEGKLKHSGSLFSVVQGALGVAGEQIVHVGDNAHSDEKMAQAAGWKTLPLPAAGVNFAQRSLVASALRFRDADTASLVRGVVAKRFHDVPASGLAPTWCEGDPARFGYSVAGPLFFGFAQWVLRQAQAQGIRRLYFLARDGDVVKRVYERITANMPDAPRAHYLLASRRSVNVASIRTLDDALALLKVNFTPCPLANLLKARFGLEATQVAVEALAAGGYANVNDMADFKLHQGRLAALVTELWPALKESARAEREALLEYYREEGLFEDEPWAVVDIGHNGTMQASLATLTGAKPLGLYFVTYSAISALAARGLNAMGYAAERLDGKGTHPYARYLLMFELLFLNAQGSFVKMVRQGSELVPVYLPVAGEEARIRFIEQAHRGACEFAEDLVRAAPDVRAVRITGAEAIAPYVAMLQSPSLPEARMLEGVAFENVYSGRDVRYILAPVHATQESVWKEARTVLSQHARVQGPFVHPVLDWLVRRTVSERKWFKYRTTPHAFFAESKRAPVRWLGRRLVGEGVRPSA